ncbi:SRPBCC family protein [uncultured Sphingomonas sp.]|uniref:SRPBCC family protein n=1 Tax=uncultured Sphingomonas sp. TaxID=158754 RepID=UPI0025EC6F13|nr:SRPBCC family protein [uncultured Sphingomonas sp.]
MANQTHDDDRTEAVEDEVVRNNQEEVERARAKGPGDDRKRTSQANAQRDKRGASGAGGKSGGGAGKTLLGLGLVAAGAGAAYYFTGNKDSRQGRGKGADSNGYQGPLISDAPDHVLRGKAKENSRNNQDGKALVGRTVTIDKPKQELYAVWRDFTGFPKFMDNVREITKLDDVRSEWTIEAPAGATVKVATRIVEDVPGETIAWVSEPDSQIETDGRVEFADAPPGRGTYVRLLIRYKPPAGTFGQMIAKVMQREPQVQARRDLRRFKQLMETGEIPVNASPSGRKSESPTEARV